MQLLLAGRTAPAQGPLVPRWVPCTEPAMVIFPRANLALPVLITEQEPVIVGQTLQSAACCQTLHCPAHINNSVLVQVIGSDVTTALRYVLCRR